MPKLNYTVYVSEYPREYNVEAETVEEARELGKEKFQAETGKSVWTAEVVRD